MSFNEQRIQKNLKRLSFPRLSGTKSEKEVSKLIENKIKELNLQPKIQDFKFSTFYSRIYPKIAFSLASWDLLIIYLNISNLFTIIAFLASVFLFFPFFYLTRNPEKIRIGKILNSKNIYIKLKGVSEGIMNHESGNTQNPSNCEVRDIILMAHMDSKGQKISARTRFISITLWTISLLILIVLFIFRGIFFFIYDIFTIIALFPLIINILVTIVFLVNTTNNQSKGVVDNASGVAVLLEILEFYANNEDKIKDANLWFVFTGAEESGTMGIRNFQKLIDHLDRKTTIVHNFESLGKSVAIFISKNNEINNPNYLNDFESKAKSYHFRTYRSSISSGVHTDGIYMFQKNYNLFEFGSTEVGKYMHSKTDSLDNVDIQMLIKLREFNIELLNEYV
jgi:hypothetical protein